jgi:glycosyltransferase domain-containing protein
MDHSVFIFTFNRSVLLKRQLGLFKLLKIHSKLYILDGSSDINEVNRNKKISKEFNAEYFFEESYINRFFLINQLNLSPYLSYCADDDLIDPRFYKKSVDFLESYKDYAVVTGRVLCLQYNSKHKYLGYRFVNHLPNDYDINTDDFVYNFISLRSAYALGCPPTHYGVRRAECHKILGKYIKELKYRTDVELLEFLSAVVVGKIKTIEVFMGLRDYYNGPIVGGLRDSNKLNNNWEFLKNIAKKELKLKGYSESYCDFASNYILDFNLPPADRAIKTTTRKNYLSFKENKARAVFEVFKHFILNNVNEFKDSGIDRIFLKSFRKVFFKND